MNVQNLTADYVVVGAGSAGAVIANRLSAASATSVVLLEAGPEDKDKFIHIPAGFAQLFQTKHDWNYLTQPQEALNGRKIYWPRGKMLGGSSSINAMMWVRGFAADYDEWADLAGPDWAFSNVVKHFRRMETVQEATEADEGVAGPLHISHQRSPRAITEDFLTAIEQAGFKRERANLPEPQGFTETRVTQKVGARWSTADGYLKPVRKRANLTILTEAHATRIIFDGTRAVGVEYEKDGDRLTVRAGKEVILCGGAVNSPQLLMLSGVGDKDELAQHGIPLVAHAPEVGGNLSDHLMVPMGYSVKSDSLFAAEKPLELVNYLARRRGMLTSNVAEAYGFVRSRQDLALPDLEILFAPAPFYNEGLIPPTSHGVALGPILLKPESRGKVSLASADPHAKVLIDPRYLSDSGGADRTALMEGLRISHRIASTDALRHQLGTYLQPPAARGTQEEIFETALNGHAHTLYHPTGTCRMGSDAASVVDPELKVRGVTGLRVADASIMPTIIRGHTHAPSVVIGEQAAELIGAGR